MLKVYPMPLGAYQTNCYILSVGERAIIVDPGDEAQKVIKYLETNGLKPEAILITHGHLDHIGALEEVQKKYEIPVYTHEEEKEFFTNSKYNFSHNSRKPIEFDELSAFNFFAEDGIIEILDQKITVFHVPGHSPGSLAFYFKDANIVLSGDALFKGSIGRTDFPNGSHEQLIKNIATKLFTLPDATVVYPGHGAATTIGDEKRMNPFF